MHLLFLVFVIGSPLFVRGYSYENGIVKCPDEIVGIPFNVTELNNTTFTKVNQTMLECYRDNNNFENFMTSCTTGVTNMTKMFVSLGTFNHSISTWDTSSVLDMSYMFWNAQNFNSDISKWDTSSVITMDAMFAYATKFNSDISNWTTSSVTKMAYMFYIAGSFNSSISTWDTSSVKYMYGMFKGAVNFNQDISNWTISSVVDMSEMFAFAEKFNSDISKWTTAKVWNMAYMFFGAEKFNSDISNWNTSSVTSMNYMFLNASNFNQSLTNWCVNISVPTDFSLHSPLDNNPAFLPLWNRTGCTNKCYNGIRNTSDYSCTCNSGHFGPTCALTPDITITVTTNGLFTAYHFNSSIVDNPTLNLATSTTYYFELGATTMISHPFRLSYNNGTQVGTVLSTGVFLTTDSVAAQYTYKCIYHPAMTGIISSSDPVTTRSSSSSTTTADPVTTTTADLVTTTTAEPVTTTNEPNTTSTPSIEEDSINVNLIIGLVSGGVVLVGLAFFVVYKCLIYPPASGYKLTTM